MRKHCKLKVRWKKIRSLLLCGMVITLAALTFDATIASATVMTTADPGGTITEIGTRIRWANTGFEASIFDNNPFAQTPTLNPVGTPVWSLNNAYAFQVTYDSVTGTLGLDVDFNRNGVFGTGESISRSAFNGMTSYAGYGFDYLSISGNEGGSTARSRLTNLVINGTALPSLAPNGLFLEQFYTDSSGNPISSIAITGDLTFLTAGTAQERPSWNFNFKNAQLAAVPEPTTILLLGFGLAGMGLLRRRFKN